MLGAAWTTVSREAEISLENMNGGSALNYLLLGLVNIFWVPIGMKLGRRPVFLITTTICMLTAVWLGYVHGTAQWMTNLAINGFGVAAYQAVIQLSVFDMFFAHQRGRTLSFYLFGQQLGSILGIDSFIILWTISLTTDLTTVNRTHHRRYHLRRTRVEMDPMGLFHDLRCRPDPAIHHL